MTLDTKTKLLGMFCAEMDGRDPLQYIREMDGDECVAAHRLMRRLDGLLKAQWTLMGSPSDSKGEVPS